MNILFLTMSSFTSLDIHNIYTDLMKELIRNGHHPYIVVPCEKRNREHTELIDNVDHHFLKVSVGNMTNVSLIKKGISTVMIGSIFYHAILDQIGQVKFDLILYSTPPITFVSTIKKLKKKWKCKTYLMLKDIFPQNAVDLGMFKKCGIIFRFFRRQEKQLYKVSDFIGCMSKANVDYLIKNNPEIEKTKVEICPNGISPRPIFDRKNNKLQIRAKYGIPKKAIIYLFGGNLGKPQGIPHLINCFKENENKDDRFFVICGNGSEYHLLDEYISTQNPTNIRLISFLPKVEYDSLAAGCDVGLIFLDNRFTIPNYPSRLLSYMENEMPVIVCSDNITDIGMDAEENGYGLFCQSDDPKKFTNCIDRLNDEMVVKMGKASRKYLERYFNSERCCRIIMSHLQR